MSRLSHATRTWVRHHDAIDAARIKEEHRRKKIKKLKKQALKKLSPDEREALGL